MNSQCMPRREWEACCSHRPLVRRALRLSNFLQWTISLPSLQGAYYFEGVESTRREMQNVCSIHLLRINYILSIVKNFTVTVPFAEGGGANSTLPARVAACIANSLLKLDFDFHLFFQRFHQ